MVRPPKKRTQRQNKSVPWTSASTRRAFLHLSFEGEPISISILRAHIQRVCHEGVAGACHASFRILRAALVMLDAVSLASLHAYEMHNRRPYKDLSVGLASDLFCGRAGEVISFKQVEIQNGDGLQAERDVPMAWDPKRPWDFMFNLVAMGDGRSFWQQQVISPALAWIAAGSQGKPRTPAEQLAAGFMIGGVQPITPQVEG